MRGRRRVAGGVTLDDVTLTRDRRGLDVPEWPALAGRGTRPHPFASPEWGRLWWERFGAGGELVTLAARRGRDVAGIVPLYASDDGGRRVLRFVGGIELTDYLGPICEARDHVELARALVDWLVAEPDEWDELDAHNLPVPWGFAEALVDFADRAGLVWQVEQEETSAILRLPSSWEAYEAGLSSKNRHELRRKRRRLWSEHPDAAVVTAPADELDAGLKTFLEMHRSAGGRKGSFMDADVASFFEAVASTFAARDELVLAFLEARGRTLAAAYGFRVGGTLYLYNSAYDATVARSSPGLVLVSELVRGAIETGMHTFDFLRGPERYKYQLGAEPVPLNNVRVLNGGGRTTT